MLERWVTVPICALCTACAHFTFFFAALPFPSLNSNKSSEHGDTVIIGASSVKNIIEVRDLPPSRLSCSES